MSACGMLFSIRSPDRIPFAARENVHLPLRETLPKRGPWRCWPETARASNSGWLALKEARVKATFGNQRPG